MGSVLTPSFVGVENALDLPQAATPLRPVQRRLSGEDPAARPAAQAGASGRSNAACAFGTSAPPSSPGPLRLSGPAIYQPLARIGAGCSSGWRGKGRIRSLPLGGGWTDHRDFPAPSGRTFIEQYRERKAAAAESSAPAVLSAPACFARAPPRGTPLSWGGPATAARPRPGASIASATVRRCRVWRLSRRSRAARWRRGSSVVQNGQAVAIVFGCCGSACSTRSRLIRLPMCSSIQKRPPPAAQHIAWLRFSGNSSGCVAQTAARTRRGASYSPLCLPR